LNLLPEKSTDNFQTNFSYQQTTFRADNLKDRGKGKLSGLISNPSMDQINRSYFLKVTCPALPLAHLQ
jgi:hypothetical protein